MIWTCKGVRRAPNCHLYTTRHSCSKSRTVASGLYIKHLCPVWWCVLFVSYWQLWILWLHIELELLNTEHGQHWIQVREADQERRRLILRDFLYCVPWKAWLQPFLIFCSCSIRTHQFVLSECWFKKIHNKNSEGLNDPFHKRIEMKLHALSDRFSPFNYYYHCVLIIWGVSSS